MRDLSRLQLSIGASNLSDGILVVAAPLLALQITRDPLQVALVSAMLTLPWALASIHTGAVIDRSDAVAVARRGNALRCLVALALIVLALLDHLSIASLVIGFFMLGLGEVLSDNGTQVGVLRAVSDQELQPANGRVTAIQVVTNSFLGGPIAGALMSVGSVYVFGAVAAGYASATAALARLSQRVGSADADSAEGDYPGTLLDGMRFVARSSRVRYATLLAFSMNFVNGGYVPLLVILLVGGHDASSIQLSELHYGLLVTIVAAGGLIGALTVNAVADHIGSRRTLEVVVLTNGFLLFLPLLLGSFLALVPFAFVLGLTGASANVLLVTRRMKATPPPLSGRVNAAARAVGMFGAPAGAILLGTLGKSVGLVPAIWTTWGVAFVTFALILWLEPRGDLEVPATQTSVES